jgi:hypothetical protein
MVILIALDELLNISIFDSIWLDLSGSWVQKKKKHDF